MKGSQYGGWLLGIGLLLHASPVLSITLLVLREGETPHPPAWPRDFHPVPATSFTLTLAGAGIALQGFLATDHPKPPQPANRRAPDSLADLCQRQPAQLVVAAGPEAARAARQACRLPALLVGISRQQLAPLLAEKRPEPVSAIYLEAEPLLNLQLVRALLPEAHTVGVLVSDPAPAWLAPLRSEADRLHLTLSEIAVTDDLSVARALRPRLAGLDAVLLPPDPTLINAWTLKPLLLMTVRQGVPVLGGLTTRYVDAGVLAAVVADEERLPAQMRPLIAELAHGHAPPPAYPTAIRVAINPTVAQTLGVAPEAVERARSWLARP